VTVPRRGDEHQGFLFEVGPVARALAEVPAAGDERSRTADADAASLPESVRLGTSSWSFPGWRGLVYGETARADRLARWGLAAYASCPLHRTVGLDRAFYQPVSERELADLASLTPDGFRFLVKGHQAVTRPDADEHGRTFGSVSALREQGRANDLFLDAGYARDAIVAPAVRGLRAVAGVSAGKLGVIVFQFPPLDLSRSGRIGGAERLIARLGTFLRGLPEGPTYAVEVRNREVLERADLAARYAEALAAARVSHGFAHHPSLPTVEVQARRLEEHGWPLASMPCLSLRWLLRWGETYEGARERYEPFDRLIDPDGVTRGQVVSLAHAAYQAGRPVYVIANNKAEGSAPRTLVELARAWRNRGG
jgi:uncharacterized protein YecE (DUF72 family)